MLPQSPWIWALLAVGVALSGWALVSSTSVFQSEPVKESPHGVEVMTNTEAFRPLGDHEVRTENVNYFQDTSGYLARPADEGSYPGVVMIHEWWGLNDNIRRMAEILATHGYSVLAVDLYNGEVATEPGRAQELSSNLDQQQAIANMQAAVDYLRNQENADRVASLGWCFGGGQSLQLALSDVSLASTVIYYGNLVTDKSRLATIDWPVLGIFGAEDQVVSVETVETFKATLNSLNVPNEFRVYPGAGHAFANPSGDSFAPQAAADAWKVTLNFLDEHLKSDS
ncbi:MAG: dienelactone hydrolase family protein [Candidatus Bipolaricaulia bacterium]